MRSTGMMMRLGAVVRLGAGIGLAALAWGAGAQQAQVGKIAGDAVRGNDSFTRYCAGCHGAQGNGRGTFARYLDPQPRDFTAGKFKCRSTPAGTLPTDQDLYATMVRGIVGTAMPIWRPLTPQQRVDMVAYVKKFNAHFASGGVGVPIVIGAEPAVTIESIRNGAAVYRRLECAKCHGASGRGDGPEANTLVDFKHLPLPPYDFTQTERFKCGATNAELYRTYRTGMDGTPMGSYADKLSEAETWDLVHFTRTLQARKSVEKEVLKAAGGKMVEAAQ